MKITQTIARFLAFFLLLCSVMPHCVIAQTTEASQGIWWEVKREFVLAPKGWQSSIPAVSVMNNNKPTVIGGKSFTFNDTAKCSSGQMVVSGNATQTSLKIAIDAKLLTKETPSKAGALSQFFGSYHFEPTLYVEEGENTRLRVTVKVVSIAEAMAKLDDPQTQQMPYAQSKINCLATRKVNALRVFGGELSVTAQTIVGQPTDSWKGDNSFEGTTTLDVSKELLSQLVENVDTFNEDWTPHMKWPFAGKTKKGFYRIHWATLLSQTEDSADFLSSSLENTVRGGEASGSIKQEITITVERIGPVRPAEAAIGVDFNRDGPIDFDKADKTSAAKPFDFWLNHDRDATVVEGKEKDQQDVSPAQGKDSADNRISVERDLEDFSRLHIQAPAAFRPDGTWKCRLSFVKPTGSPSLRLFGAVSPGPEFLTNPDTAKKQIENPSNLVVGAQPVEIPASLFRSVGAGKFRATLLFEARSAGQGALQVSFIKGGKEQKAKNPVYLHLRPIRDFYDYHLLPAVDLNGVTTGYQTPSATAKDIAASQTSDYILFVHGWRMQEWSKKAAAETAFKRLWQRGYKGKFGMFSWPTEYVELVNVLGNLVPDPKDRQNYDRSERKAWLSAAALRQLLISLKSQKVRVLAHSMGNVVASEALLQESQSQTPQKIVHTYVATQAATVAQAYDASIEDNLQKDLRLPNIYKTYPATSRPYFEGTAERKGIGISTGQIVNYYNAADHALKGWQLNQLSKPDKGYGYGEVRVPALDEKTFFRGGVVNGTLYGKVLDLPSDRYEIFAHVAPAFSLALGTQNMAGPFSESVDLGAAPFNFTNTRSDHSAQFNSNLMQRHKYWDRLMKDFEIQVSPPK